MMSTKGFLMMRTRNMGTKGRGEDMTFFPGIDHDFPFCSLLSLCFRSHPTKCSIMALPLFLSFSLPHPNASRTQTLDLTNRGAVKTGEFEEPVTNPFAEPPGNGSAEQRYETWPGVEVESRRRFICRKVNVDPRCSSTPVYE